MLVQTAAVVARQTFERTGSTSHQSRTCRQNIKIRRGSSSRISKVTTKSRLGDGTLQLPWATRSPYRAAQIFLGTSCSTLVAPKSRFFSTADSHSAGQTSLDPLSSPVSRFGAAITATTPSQATRAADPARRPLPCHTTHTRARTRSPRRHRRRTLKREMTMTLLMMTTIPSSRLMLIRLREGQMTARGSTPVSLLRLPSLPPWSSFLRSFSS
mmetsp:Transcript_13752/g.35301  ORF Transcript_13752/g.35301 Transcript_13752/m.35301 type:complete len:213 (+) Transcript_13752:1766-2404(+)